MNFPSRKRLDSKDFFSSPTSLGRELFSLSMALFSSIDEEVRLLEILDNFRPVGPERHFNLAYLLQKPSSLLEPLCRRATIWSFLNKLFQLEKLNELYYLQLVIQFNIFRK